jgi:membrane peptidoglycan carboxypeptidase
MRFTRLLLLLLLGFIAYEGWRIYQAHQATPTLLAEAHSNLALTWSDLSKRQQEILLKVEDPAFFTHPGVDFLTPGAGITTITQALVKRFYFDPFTPGFAKIEQSLIAWLVVNRQVPKEDQLTLFLNHAYFGTGDEGPLIGFPTAAQHFFKRPVGALSEADYIALVASLIAPKTHAPGSPANDQRSKRITRYLTGACAPANNGDVWYPTCQE